MSCQFFWDVTLLNKLSVLLVWYTAEWPVNSSGLLRCWMSCQFFWNVTLLNELSVLLGCYSAEWAVSSSGMLLCWMSCQFFWDVTLLNKLSVLLVWYTAEWPVNSSGLLRCWMSCQFFWDVTLLNELSVLLECYAEGKSPTESLRRRWQIRSNIEFVLKEMWRYDIEWIYFWSGQVNVGINCRVPKIVWNFLISRKSVSFSRGTLLHGVSCWQLG